MEKSAHGTSQGGCWSYAARDAALLKKPVSDAQLDLLKREANIVPAQGTTRGEAQEIIRRAFRERNFDPNAPWLASAD